MKAFTAQLFVLACALGARSLHARVLPMSVTDRCPSAQEVTSSIIAVDGQEIIRQTFTCPDGDFISGMTSETKEISTSAIGKRSSLEARNTIGCLFPQNMLECQCGASFTCVCFEGDVAPGEFDCTSLINSVTSTTEGVPTFTVQPSGLEIVTLRTCALEFVNLRDTVLEYCWDNLNFIGEQAWTQCVSDESDRVVGGLCTAGSGQYRVSLGPAASA